MLILIKIPAEMYYKSKILFPLLNFLKYVCILYVYILEIYIYCFLKVIYHYYNLRFYLILINFLGFEYLYRFEKKIDNRANC